MHPPSAAREAASHASEPATIALDARKLDDFGIGSYIRGLVGGFAALDCAERFVLLVANDDAAERLADLPANFRCVIEPAPNYSLRELTAVSRTLGRERVDLFHAPHYVLPLRPPCPTVVTIHDLIHLLFPEFLPNRGALLYAHLMLRRAARVADRVITVSENTRGDLCERLRLSADEIEVIHNGIADRFFDAAADHNGDNDEADARVDRTLTRHGLERGYLLFVGNPKPHKNLDRVLDAHALLEARAREHGAATPPLVILGARAERAEILERAQALGLGPSVRVLGFVPDEELPPLMSAASVLIAPSLYEGFGLPVAEAMAVGTAVVTSASSSLAEIAGDAALLVDPHDVTAIADAVRRLLDHPSERARLESAGRERAQRFRWNTAARATLAVYAQVLGRDLGSETGEATP